MKANKFVEELLGLVHESMDTRSLPAGVRNDVIDIVTTVLVANCLSICDAIEQKPREEVLAKTKAMANAILEYKIEKEKKITTA